MKYKHLLIILVVFVVLFVYNLLLYSFLNKIIENNTKDLIIPYLNGICNCEAHYKYIMATNNDDGSINVFVKTIDSNLENYYRFVFTPNYNNYKLIDINNDMPLYIK
ncbi:MAG: hypothetical protein E7163_04435 [Firmicutes bacterium]|nr:hypothetical protein [Bacillota bacterium]